MPRNVFDRRRGINTGSVIIHTLDVRRTGMYLKHDNRTLGGYSDLRRMNECASSHTMYTAYRLVRYTKVHLDFCLRFSTLIGQIGRVPLFGAGSRRYVRSRLFRLAVPAFWRALTASWRQKGKRNQIFPRAIRTTELPSNPSPLTFRNNQIQSYRPLRHTQP